LAETAIGNLAAGLQPFGGKHSNSNLESQTQTSEGDSAGFLKETYYAAVRTLVENPVNSIKELTSTNHANNNELHLVPQEKPAAFNTKDWYAQQLGSVIGMLPLYLAIRGSVGSGFKMMGATAESANALDWGWKAVGTRACESAVSGAIYEGVLKPVQRDDAPGFWQQRAKNALVGSVMYGGTSGATDVLRNLEGAAMRQIFSAGAGPGILSGIAGGMIGGGFATETSTLLNQHRFASAPEIKESLATTGLIGLGLRGAELPFELRAAARATEAEVPLKTDISPSARVQETLANGRLANIEQKIGVGGYGNKELTFANLVSDDGHTVPVILRPLAGANIMWNEVKLENGSIAHELHDRLGFDNPSAAVAQRVFEVNGSAPANYLVEERLPGGSWLERIPEMANNKFPQPPAADGVEPDPPPVEENIVKLLDSEPQLKSTMELAIGQRMLYGDLDFNSGNLMLNATEADGVRTYEAYNIDLKRSFTPQAEPTWAQEVMQFPSRQIGQYFGGKPFSAATQQIMETAVERLTAMKSQSDPLVTRIGEKNFDAMIGRGQALINAGLPKCYWILDPEFAKYYTEMETADKFWRQRWPQLYPGESQ